MLPWVFAILVLLNLGLFFWGYQREKSLEPPETPVPEGRYEIRLVGEPLQEPKHSADRDSPDVAGKESMDEQTMNSDVSESESATELTETERVEAPEANGGLVPDALTPESEALDASEQPPAAPQRQREGERNAGALESDAPDDQAGGGETPLPISAGAEEEDEVTADELF
ncbi:MAG: hypothetical protein LJE70_13835 [Chromatiaceae bacterium]|jgi:hypothetical protein|nr:hypothetical protein [Chromatiaceae bacterium]